MNKKKLGNLILICFAVGLAFTLIDLPTKKYSYQDAVSNFVRDNLERNVRYVPQGFTEVNESFLISQPEIAQSMSILTDSINKQLGMLDGIYGSNALSKLLENARYQSKSLSLDRLTSYLSIDADLKRRFKQEDLLGPSLQKRLYEEETRMHQAIAELNSSLGLYNLSVFGLDLEHSETIIYLHNFQLNDPVNGVFHKQGVFELDRESKEVVSFREI